MNRFFIETETEIGPSGLIATVVATVSECGSEKVFSGEGMIAGLMDMLVARGGTVELWSGDAAHVFASLCGAHDRSGRFPEPFPPFIIDLRVAAALRGAALPSGPERRPGDALAAARRGSIVMSAILACSASRERACHAVL